MADVELALRDYGSGLDEQCPEVTFADVQRALSQEDLMTTPTIEPRAEATEDPRDLIVEAPSRVLRRSRVVLAAAASAVIVVLIAVFVRDGDQNSNVTTDDLNTQPRSQEVTLEEVVRLGEGDEVVGSVATLRATDSEAVFNVMTIGLEPQHAFTAWVVALDVDACVEILPSWAPCDPSFLGENPGIGNMGYLGGAVVADDGSLSIEGSVTSDGLPKQWFDTPLAPFARTKFVILLRDHGPVVEGRLEEMTGTFRGGCVDQSVYAWAPESAVIDGEPGEYFCNDEHKAIFDIER